MSVFSYVKKLFNVGKTTKAKPAKKTVKKKIAKKKTVKKKTIKKKTVSKKSPKPKKKTSKKKSVSKPRKKTAKKKTIKKTVKKIGVVTHYFGKIQVCIIRLKTNLSLGDAIQIKGMHADFFQVVDSMQINHKNVSSGKKGDEIGIKVVQPVRENYKVYGAKN